MNRSQKSLFDALDKRLLDPDIREGGNIVTIWGARHDAVDPGTIIAVHATWVDDILEYIYIFRKGEGREMIGYRELMAELKTGQRADTGESRIVSILRGLFLDQTSSTKQERETERSVKAEQAAAKRAVAEAEKAQRAAAREAASDARIGIGEDV